ncbi:hypothetical protein CC86DRAFT_298332 [Ophiobolus disseminans]|uniref:DUF6594 domain-containing protein n=1 Tax=Ophiobolus disseminans TaxID=1469910 RepID=A0A6A6ZSH1_9PLEO|nr:hypothetical protein CC86DRAFT_298332 [Ophiobolus disseminans]
MCCWINNQVVTTTFPAGYPSFAAFLGSHASFRIFRRFTSLRLRLMLCKQDDLCILEQQLDAIDSSESRLLYLGSVRQDQNAERKRVLHEIDVALCEYEKDSLVERNERTFARQEGRSRDLTNVRNWLSDKGSIARKESEYIENSTDLMTLEKPAEDSALDGAAGMIERVLMRLPRLLSSRLRVSHSSEPRLWIFPRRLLHGLARVLLAWLLIALLFVPIVLIYGTKSVRTRLILIGVSATLFIFILTVGTKAKTAEVFVAGTTYATVLVVFLAQNGIDV